jgi:hypothetical protein
MPVYHKNYRYSPTFAVMKFRVMWYKVNFVQVEVVVKYVKVKFTQNKPRRPRWEVYVKQLLL